LRCAYIFRRNYMHRWGFGGCATDKRVCYMHRRRAGAYIQTICLPTPKGVVQCGWDAVAAGNRHNKGGSLFVSVKAIAFMQRVIRYCSRPSGRQMRHATLIRICLLFRCSSHVHSATVACAYTGSARFATYISLTVNAIQL